VYAAVFLRARVCGLGPILLYVCPHTTICVAESVDWAPYFYTCVLILLYTWQSLWIGPHATIYVSSYYYICADSVDWAVDTNYAKGSDAPGTRSKASSKSSSKDAAAVDTNYAKGSDAPGTRSKASSKASSKDAAAVDTNYAKGSAPGTRSKASSKARSKDAAAALIP
jgi:hypothetical protein